MIDPAVSLRCTYGPEGRLFVMLDQTFDVRLGQERLKRSPGLNEAARWRMFPIVRRRQMLSLHFLDNRGADALVASGNLVLRIREYGKELWR